MASIVGGLAMSHGPQLLMPALKWPELPTRTKGPFHPKPNIAVELTPEAMVAKQERCNKALAALREKLTQWQPDALIVVGDDQHENILDDNQPPFLIYMSEEADATLHFLYLGATAEEQMTRYRVDAGLARSLLTGLMDEGFDPAWSTELRDPTGLGHAFGRALKFLMPERPIPIIPLMVNTYFPPAPSAKRCLQLGNAVRQVVEKLPGDARVVVLASGGLTHFVVDEEFDGKFITALQKRDEAYLSSIPSSVFVAGTSEMLCWLVAAGAMKNGATVVDYIPCYRNSDGVGCGMGFVAWE